MAAWISLGGITAAQGGCRREIRGLARLLSSACQIVNERLMKCVQPALKTNKAELKAFHANFFKSSLQWHHAALERIKNLNMRPSVIIIMPP